MVGMRVKIALNIIERLINGVLVIPPTCIAFQGCGSHGAYLGGGIGEVDLLDFAPGKPIYVAGQRLPGHAIGEAPEAAVAIRGEDAPANVEYRQEPPDGLVPWGRHSFFSMPKSGKCI